MIERELLVVRLKNPAERARAFGDLVDAYQERLYWHIRKIVIVHEDADDILQNVFIKVHKSIDKFNERSQLYSWMYRIATNESLSYLKSKAHRNSMNSEELIAYRTENLVSDSFFDGDKAMLELHRIVGKLPEKQRLVFNMKYFEDLKYDEISAILNTSVGALKASYHHAVQKIKSEIKTLNLVG